MVVELKIKKKNPWAGLLKYRHCFDYIAPYFTRSGSIYTGLTPEEEREFEKALGYPEGHLAKTSDFWKTFCVKVGARGLLLDDQFALQRLQIKFLTGHKRVATSLDTLTANKDYLLINREAEAAEKNNMRKCLRLFGIRATDMSNELVESTMFDIVDKKSKEFLNKWVNNTKKDTQFILEEAIAKGIIRKEHTQYWYGTDMFADSLDDAIAYLDSKKNQDLKLSIINEIKNK